MAGDGPFERRRGGVQPTLTLVDLGQRGVSRVQARLEPDGRFEVDDRVAQAVRLDPHQAAVGEQDVSKIVAGIPLEDLAVIGLRGRDRLLRVLPETGGLRFIGVRLGDLLEGLVALLPGDEGTHQIQGHQLAMAPDAGGQTGPGLAQRLRLHVEVADREQEVGRRVLGIGLQGRVERTNRVGEPAAEDQLATAEEVVQRASQDRSGWLLDSRGPGPPGRPWLEAIGAAAVVRGGRLRAKPDRPVEDPQSFGRLHRLR